jgi:hypothetical protein
MGCLQTGKSTAPVLLHLIAQNSFQSPLREAPSHVCDRRLAHIESSN